jgi:hypothetical protein
MSLCAPRTAELCPTCPSVPRSRLLTMEVLYQLS